MESRKAHGAIGRRIKPVMARLDEDPRRVSGKAPSAADEATTQNPQEMNFSLFKLQINAHFIGSCRNVLTL
ncbi:MAG: hypothetical protein VYD57_00820 [Pseudomonadota bacterium]|nr:hypothetical protein [Pseudomonadota bacterium]